jgi:hypothetical protein
VPERRDRDFIWLNAHSARPNFDLDTWKTVLHFVLIHGRRLFGAAVPCFGSSGDGATEQAQKKTIEPIPNRLIYLHNFGRNFVR